METFILAVFVIAWSVMAICVLGHKLSVRGNARLSAYAEYHNAQVDDARSHESPAQRAKRLSESGIPDMAMIDTSDD